MTVGLILGLAGLCSAVGSVLSLTSAETAGLFAGSTTNTPALQAASDALTAGDPVVAYSLVYPAAVVAMLVMTTLVLGRRLPLPAPLERSAGDDRLSRAYELVFPVAMITKIVVVQFLV